jgi:hypothetical protein
LNVKYKVQSTHDAESLRLEAGTPCVGFDDLLDVTLGINHPDLDTTIVVTSHEDRRTQQVAEKHGAICVQTDLFRKNGRRFNKGAALNAGMDRWQYHSWRLHLDSNIALPDNFRRMLFNHTHLEANCIYGADRVDVVGLHEMNAIRKQGPQHRCSAFVASGGNRPLSPPLRGPVARICANWILPTVVRRVPETVSEEPWQRGS